MQFHNGFPKSQLLEQTFVWCEAAVAFDWQSR